MPAVLAREVVAPIRVEVAGGRQGAELQYRLGAIDAPSGPAAVESVPRETAARALDDPRRDGQAACERVASLIRIARPATSRCDVRFRALIEATAETETVVIGADFHHGEGSEPSHVSGMAIRFREHSGLPYDKLGEIDVVATSGDSAAQATALDRLKERATKMGADEVVNVEFHHGEEKGEASHLTGLAICHHRAKTW